MINQPPLSRRYFLGECGIGLGKIAAASLLTNQLSARSLSPKPAPEKPKAKAVIHLFMAGAPSQLELFDPKPQLSKLEGSPLPKSIIGDHGANHHGYDGAAFPMLHFALAHCIDATSVLAHSIFAAFFLVWLQVHREFLVLCDLVRVRLRATCVCVVFRNFCFKRPSMPIV